MNLFFSSSKSILIFAQEKVIGVCRYSQLTPAMNPRMSVKMSFSFGAISMGARKSSIAYWKIILYVVSRRLYETSAHCLFRSSLRNRSGYQIVLPVCQLRSEISQENCVSWLLLHSGLKFVAKKFNAFILLPQWMCRFPLWIFFVDLDGESRRHHPPVILLVIWGRAMNPMPPTVLSAAPRRTLVPSFHLTVI